MSIEEKTEKLIQFIKDNKLNFNVAGSGLNSVVVTLCGYALYVDDDEGELDSSDVINAIDKSFQKIPTFRSDYVDEVNRVFPFAESNYYGVWWKNPMAKREYKF